MLIPFPSFLVVTNRNSWRNNTENKHIEPIPPLYINSGAIFGSGDEGYEMARIVKRSEPKKKNEIAREKWEERP